MEDSRNRIDKNKHIREQLEALGYKVDRSKIYVGDYQFADSGKIVVDTKQDVLEICQNVIQDHERFRNECVRAQEANIKLVILIADETITGLQDIFSWKNPRRFYSKKCTTGRQLGKILYSMQSKYGVTFHFCKKHEIGKRIVELLGGSNESIV